MAVYLLRSDGGVRLLLLLASVFCLWQLVFLHLGLLAEAVQHSTCVSHHRLTSVLFQLWGWILGSLLVCHAWCATLHHELSYGWSVLQSSAWTDFSELSYVCTGVWQPGTPSQISTAACVALERASLMLTLLGLECPSGNKASTPSIDECYTPCRDQLLSTCRFSWLCCHYVSVLAQTHQYLRGTQTAQNARKSLTPCRT
jgi:hypothetical protein